MRKIQILLANQPENLDRKYTFLETHTNTNTRINTKSK